VTVLAPSYPASVRDGVCLVCLRPHWVERHRKTEKSPPPDFGQQSCLNFRGIREVVDNLLSRQCRNVAASGTWHAGVDMLHIGFVWFGLLTRVFLSSISASISGDHEDLGLYDPTESRKKDQCSETILCIESLAALPVFGIPGEASSDINFGYRRRKLKGP